MDGYTIAEAVHEEVLNLIKGRDEIELKVTSRCAVHLCILIILTVIVSECDILIFLDIMKYNLNKKRIKFKKKKIDCLSMMHISLYMSLRRNMLTSYMYVS